MKEILPDVPYLEPGEYVHYKGGHYEVIGVALDSEDLEPNVVYRALGKRAAHLWVRPYSMFTENVTIDGQEVPRFKKHVRTD